MDKISQPPHNYLKLAHQSALLVSQADKANLNVLLTMLGTLDKDIIDAYYGLFATPQVPITQLGVCQIQGYGRNYTGDCRQRREKAVYHPRMADDAASTVTFGAQAY